MPRPHPCLAPPPAPIAPHHLSTAPLRPHQLGSPRPHRDHRVPSPASHLPHCVPPSASPYVATEQIPRSSPPHHDHRAPPPSYTCCASPSASRPPCADIRVTPPSLSSRCGGPRALAGKNRAVCIPFSPNARKRPLSWQHLPEMHAFRDQDGNILAPCIHFRVQSGDSGYMARESCRQGPFFASRNPKSRMARRCCQRRPAFLRQQPAVRRNGLCAMRQRHVTRGMAERALRPAARAWPACRMRPPLSSRLCPPRPAPLPSRPRSSPPSYTCRASLPASRPPRAAIRRVAHCSRGEPPIGLFLPPSCCPRRRIAPIDARSPAPPGPRPARTEPQPRANRTPAPRQPSPGPPVEPSAPIRALPPAAPRPAARVPLRFR